MIATPTSCYSHLLDNKSEDQLEYRPLRQDIKFTSGLFPFIQDRIKNDGKELTTSLKHGCFPRKPKVIATTWFES